MSLRDIVTYLDESMQRNRLPVPSVRKNGASHLVRTTNGNYVTKNVVIATGLYQSPKIPRFARDIRADVLRLHSMHYRNLSSLPDGAILVVGTGQSGAQIAEELYQSGRTVYVSIGSAGRVPRRYRERDVNDWFTRMGMFDTTVVQLKWFRAVG